MRFRCLVMDHDDTTVNSTATIHFPSFLAYLKLVRPDASYTLEDYFRKNFDPGIMALFTGELGFSEEELEGEFRFWQDWVRTRVPDAYPGIREILRRHKEAGGYIAVVSHSMRGSIERDYRENGLPEPDIIFGWEQPRATSTMMSTSSTSAATAISSGRFLRSQMLCFLLLFIAVPP